MRAGRRYGEMGGIAACWRGGRFGLGLKRASDGGCARLGFSLSAIMPSWSAGWAGLRLDTQIGRITMGVGLAGSRRGVPASPMSKARQSIDERAARASGQAPKSQLAQAVKHGKGKRSISEIATSASSQTRQGRRSIAERVARASGQSPKSQLAQAVNHGKGGAYP